MNACFLRLAFVVCFVSVAGCGLQGVIAARSADGEALSVASKYQGRLHAARGSGPYASLGFTMANPAGDRGAGVRSVSIGGGYRFKLIDLLRLELGGAFGAGNPASVEFVQTAVYTGLDSAFLIRLPWIGGHDNFVGAAPIGYALDAVLTGQGGYWSRAVGAPDQSQAEFGFGLGLRVTFFSDLLSAEDDSWEVR